MQEIKQKGFSIVREEDIQEVGVRDFAYTPTDFAKIKVGAKMLDDAVFTIFSFLHIIILLLPQTRNTTKF